MTGSAQDFTFIEGINEDSHWLTAKFDHRIVWDLGNPFAMLELDLTPASGEGTILNRARHKNLVWVGRHCHLGEKLHQPGFQLGHQGTSGVWLLLGNMMYIVQIFIAKMQTSSITWSVSNQGQQTYGTYVHLFKET